MQGLSLKISLRIIAALGSVIATGAEATSLCFVPGYGGGNAYSRQELPSELGRRGVPFVFFDVGHGMSVEDTGRRFVEILNEQLARDPDFRCHLIGYSMGGLVVRYAGNHLSVRKNDGQNLPLTALLDSLTTVASPHQGTPLARVLNQYLGTIDAGSNELSPENVVVFNDARFADTYSPEISSVRNLSYRSYIRDSHDTDRVLERLGYEVIKNDAHRQGIDEESGYRNDGIVPTASQNYGKVLADLRAPHGFFGSDIGWTPSAVELYEVHWHFLNKTLPLLKARRQEAKRLQRLEQRLELNPSATLGADDAWVDELIEQLETKTDSALAI